MHEKKPGCCRESREIQPNLKTCSLPASQQLVSLMLSCLENTFCLWTIRVHYRCLHFITLYKSTFPYLFTDSGSAGTPNHYRQNDRRNHIIIRRRTLIYYGRNCDNDSQVWRDGLVVSTFDQRPRGRGFESAGCGLSRSSNRGPVALCTMGLGLLNPPSSRGR